MILRSGTTASPGLASGEAVLYRPQDLRYAPGKPESVDGEVRRLQEAADRAVQELAALQASVRTRLGEDFAHIFRSQQTIVEDEAILGEVYEAIRTQTLTAEAALALVFDAYAAMFGELSDDDYNKSRGADIEDVHQRLLRNLLGLPEVSLSRMDEGSIVIAEDLLPSDTATMDTDHVRAIITEKGGPTSHVAILARSLRIPAAVATRNVLEAVHDRDEVFLDATDPGEAYVVVAPDENKRSELAGRLKRYELRQARSAAYTGRRPVTTDGHLVEFSANVGSTAELAPAASAGATSIGLYRTEFLFLNSSRLPDEEQQFEAYRTAAEQFSDGYVIIRTLDIGGDKQVTGLPVHHERNPFLGNRGLRFCLSRPELFRTQLRAILRASAYGDVRVMFPMVAGLNELNDALVLFNQERNALASEGVPYHEHVQVGVMIEVPSAVLLAEELAQRVSFFSIGTNDLTQYLLASDRLNEQVARYYRRYDPAVFRAVRQVVQAAHRHNCSVGVCGELGGDALAVPALLGLGVDELSMSPSSIAEATWYVCNDTYESMQKIAERVIRSETDTEIEAVLTEHYREKE
ncbi:MAG: phosphoenolpyruvate--protein phosphotransferase [Spirochaetaceae bacterium]